MGGRPHYIVKQKTHRRARTHNYRIGGGGGNDDVMFLEIRVYGMVVEGVLPISCLCPRAWYKSIRFFLADTKFCAF